MKGYTGNMLSCLDEKVPLIKDCEARVHVAWKDKADSLLQRQRQDYLDAAAAFASNTGSSGTPALHAGRSTWGSQILFLY